MVLVSNTKWVCGHLFGCDKVNFDANWLYVLVMLRTRLRVNPHSIVAWMSRNSLLEAGAKGEVTATGLEPRTT